MPEKTKSVCSRLLTCDFVEVCLILVFICLLALTLFLVIPWQKGGDATDPPVVPCCTDIATKVLRLANVSVDPCTNFMDYACFNWREDDIRDAFNTKIRSTITYPTLHGALTDSAALEINTYYSSCKTISLQGNDMLQGTVKTLVDEFGFAKTMEQNTLVRLVTLLSVRYGVDTVLRFQTVVTDEYIILGVSGVEEVRYLSEKYDKVLRDLVLSAANRYLGTSVPLSQLQRKFKNRGSASIFGERVSVGVGVLTSIMSKLDETFWVTSLEEAGYWNDSTQVSVKDVTWVKSILEELVANRMRVAAIVHILVRAAMELSHEAFGAHTSNSMRTFCFQDVTSLHVPWHVLLTQKLTDPSKDGVVRGIYATLLHTVKEDLFSHLVSGAPADQRDKVELQPRLLLPSVITARTWSLPHMTKNYWTNLLQVKNFTRIAYRDPTSNAYFSSSFEAALQPRIVSVNEFIVVSPSAYGLLDFDKDTPDFVNAASFGIRLASAIWRNVYYQNWQIESVQKKFSILLNCPDVKRRQDSNIFLPYLSLPTVVRAYHTGSSWRAPVGAGQLERLSRGQLFYILYYVHSSCQYAVQRRENAVDAMMMADVLNSFVKGVLDFQCTFGCPSTSVDKQCFPTVTESKGCSK